MCKSYIHISLFVVLETHTVMSRPQAESVIKNIIREIAQECAVKGESVSETLVAFIVSNFYVIFNC